ncbi:MAG: M61 family peptidase [Acidobacteriota bacterium]
MPTKIRVLLLTLVAAVLTWNVAAAQPLTLEVDATDAPRLVLHARMSIPATPGPLTLLYPKWIPGEHAPTGPLTNLVGLEISAGGQALEWRRDPVEMTAIHCTVPAGATAVEAMADFLYPGQGGTFTGGPSATDALAILNWNQVMMYPAGRPANEIVVAPTLRLPTGWSFATALQGERDGDTARFAAVSLNTLIDSPVLLGAHLEILDLGQHGGALHRLAIAADSAAALAAPKDFADGYQRLIDEAQTLFAGRHYRAYTWLLALSDHVQHFGLEHHESSDNRREEQTLTTDGLRRTLPALLAHEYAHSWNGKYRRPAGLLSPDYQKPMAGELLWVYEGLTEYVGFLLPARAGLWTPEYYRAQVALLTARLDREPGRSWRPLGDTADAAPLLYSAPREWRSWRRGTDFYEESLLLWLEVDTTLRRASGGKLSLDDFCHAFHGGSGPPSVSAYDLDDVVTALGALVPQDWRAFFHDRLQRVQPRAPIGGLEESGWRLVYTDQPNQALTDEEARGKTHDWTFTLGLLVDQGGKVLDTTDGPAAKAGIVPGMKLLAVGGRVFNPWAVDAALAAAKLNRKPIEVVAQLGEAVKTLQVGAYDGLRYPHLERIPGTPDLLAQILAPHALARPH